MLKTLLSAALTGVVAASVAMSTQAADDLNKVGKEKCYGIAKAGKNDCHSADGSHTCAGLAIEDNNKNDWAFVAIGECQKLGGIVAKPEDDKR